MTPFNPDSWLDLLAYVIIGAPALLAAVATVRHARRDKPIRDKVNEIHDQTVNNHGDRDHNMRDDIDDLAQLVRDGFKTVGRDIGGLREELRTERLERIAGDRQHHTEPFG